MLTKEHVTQVLEVRCTQPVYLRSILHTHHSTRSLRLSNTNLLCAPFVRTSFGSRSFSVADPKIWNSLPQALRMCTSHDTFRHQLKTHYFQQAFQPLSASSLAPQIRLWLTIVRDYKLYLLTYLLLTFQIQIYIWIWNVVDKPPMWGITSTNGDGGLM